MKNFTRNVILSLKDHFEERLQSENYDFTFVSSWAEDDKIVLPQDYVDGKGLIKLPAGKITINSDVIDRGLEIGGGSRYFLIIGNVFIHAITEGQLYDLLDIFLDSLTVDGNRVGNILIPIYDFSETGYPSDLAVKINDLEIVRANKSPRIDLSEQNVALKFGGMVSFTGKILKGVS